MLNTELYDVVIVGSGHVGALMAYELGMRKKRVLLIEAGPATPSHREDYMENFFLNTAKTPESPYPPDARAQDPSHTNAPRPTMQMLDAKSWRDPNRSYLTYTSSSLPFASTYERLAGGTGNHWTGTTLRMAPSDLRLKTLYGKGRDWPLTYDELEPHYGKVEKLIGVSANVADQEKIGTTYAANYQYPMPGIPASLLDQYIKEAVEGAPLTSEAYALPQTIVSPTPAARNSVPYDNRRACHGNTNCTPICPIQAKYDATWTLGKALSTGFVEVRYKTVVDRLIVGPDGLISGVHCIEYDDISVPAKTGKLTEYVASGSQYILAASAIENAKILLNSPWPGGKTSTVANTSGQVGRNLMDHATYLAWGMFPQKRTAHGYRGPMSTSGIESLRDGKFRASRAAWRIEIGNEGWSWPTGDPYTSGLDYLYGTNEGGLNSTRQVRGNRALVNILNQLFTRQFRIAFLVEQEAAPENRVELSPNATDNLGVPRPMLTYGISDYTKAGFEMARIATTEFMTRLGATEFTQTHLDSPTVFTFRGQDYNYTGAGHICGTHLMGDSPRDSVVNTYQQSWDHANLFLVGGGSMASVGTQNPTLTMLAMASRTMDGMFRTAR